MTTTSGHLSRSSAVSLPGGSQPLSPRLTVRQHNSSVSSARTAIVPWRKRADLIIQPHDTSSWVVKDPLSLQYVLLNEQEMCVLRMLQGPTCIQHIVERLNAAWPGQPYQAIDVVDLIHQFAAGRLVVSEKGAAPRLQTSGPPVGLLKWVVQGSSRLLRLQIPLFDPSKLLSRLQPFTGWLFSRTARNVAIGLVLTAAVVLVVRFEQFMRELPEPADFFGPDNLLILLASFVLVKTLHELGHAGAAWRSGIECREAGILLMFLTPVLYTNVSDAWMAGRRRRLLITGAGILMELVVASICLILWSMAAPGMVRTFLANTVVLCTVGTILFNGNPLLKYDGYFLLTDAVGRPNLAQQAAARLRSAVENLLLGPEESGLPRQEPWLLVYGFLSVCYRVVLSISILSMLSHIFDRWQLRIAGSVLAGFAAMSLIVVPASRMSGNLLAALLHRRHPGRSLVRAVLMIAGLLLIINIPLPHSVTLPGVVESSGTPVFATLGGQLRDHLEYGTIVQPGQTVATLDDADLRKQSIQLAGEMQRQELLVRALELRRDPQNAVLLPEAREMLDTYRRRHEQFEVQIQRLTIVSPAAGQLQPPRPRRGPQDDVTLPGWLSDPLSLDNEQAFVEPGTLLGYVADVHALQVLLAVDEDVITWLKPDQVATFQATGLGGQVLTGRVQRLSAFEVEELPEELTATGMIMAPAARTPTTRPHYWQAAIRIELPQDHGPPRLYSTGLARIQIAPQSLLQRLIRSLRSTFG